MKAETQSLHSAFSYPVGPSGANASSHGSYFMPGSVLYYLFLDFGQDLFWGCLIVQPRLFSWPQVHGCFSQFSLPRAHIRDISHSFDWFQTRFNEEEKLLLYFINAKTGIFFKHQHPLIRGPLLINATLINRKHFPLWWHFLQKL